MKFWQTLIDIISYPVRLVTSAPMAVISGPRRLLGLPLPLRVALITTFVLLVSAVLIQWCVAGDKLASDWTRFAWRWVIILPLIIAIGFVVHYAVKLWLTGSPSPFPDIDQAWQQGIKALSAQGIDVTSVPIFLVVGVGDDRHERHLLKASGLPFRVRDVPSGPGAVHFYASENAVFVTCTQTSRLSRFVSNPVVQGAAPAAGGGGSPNLRATMTPGSSDAGNSPGGGAPNMHGTVVAGSSSAPTAARTFDLRGTMVSGTMTPDGQGAGGSGPPTAKLSSTEFSEHGERLNYLCYLLRQARQPFCPINGILCVLPYRLILRGAMEANEIQRAMREDLTTIRTSTRLRCPVVVMVSGMESESGFMELIRRVGVDRARIQRFGKGYGVWNAPTDEQMRAVTTHACGAFEDAVYQLFKERDGYNKPGNGKLYQLLCKIRNEVRGRLAGILAQGIGFNAREAKPAQDQLLMGGCYFAATGESDDTQAFVKSVFEKFTLENLDNELDWTPEAIAEDNRYHNWARVLYLASAVLCVVVAVLLVNIISSQR